MSYFKNFSLIPYKFGTNADTTEYTNISQYSTILDQIEDNSSAYQLIQLRDGERPDQLSQRLYDTVDLHWTFFLLNPGLKDHGWPLSQQDLLVQLDKDFPGVCMVVFGSKVSGTTGNEMHILVGSFDVGDTVVGQDSGATGVVYAKNVLMGQIFVKDIVGTFDVNETIRSGDHDVTVSIIHDPAYLGFSHVVDGNGDNVDVDYSVDFRGRGSEGDEDVQGGVFDDPTNPDVYTHLSPYTMISFYEEYVDLNDELRRVKVLTPGIARQVTKLLRESLDA